MNNFTYYLSANSSDGYTSFFDEYLNSINKIIVLKNITKKSKTKLFDKIINILDNSDISYDRILRTSTPDETDAIILTNNSTVIADNHLFLKEIPLYADTVDFSENLSMDFSLNRKLSAIKIKEEKLTYRMISHLKEAKTIHDQWEKIYISNMDFEAIDNATEVLINSIFSDKKTNKNIKNISNVNRFFGTMLPRNSINFIDELTKDMNTRIFIKGRPGTGKSTVLKKIVSAAQNKGYDTETYYCSLDPKSLDMVVIRDIGVCVFDSTKPHEKFPCFDTDIIFDIYEIAVKPNTDELFSSDLMHIESLYNLEIKKAKECLYSISVLRDKYDKLICADEKSIDESITRVIALASI